MRVAGASFVVGKPFNPHRRFRGVFIPLGLLSYAGLSDGAKLLYGRLCLFAGKAGDCFADRDTIAREMGSSVATVGRQFEELVKQGFIRRARRGPGQTAKCEFLWHAALGPSQRASDSAIVSHLDSAEMRRQDSAKVSHQERARQRKSEPSDSAKVSCLIKEEKIPLKDSLTPERANGASKLPILVNGKHHDWPRGGWDTPEQFETWWRDLVRKHPNTRYKPLGRTKALELLFAGKLVRCEFEAWYERYIAGERQKNGEPKWRQYVSNLFQLMSDTQWDFEPEPQSRPPSANTYESEEGYTRRIQAE